MKNFEPTSKLLYPFAGFQAALLITIAARDVTNGMLGWSVAMLSISIPSTLMWAIVNEENLVGRAQGRFRPSTKEGYAVILSVVPSALGFGLFIWNYSSLAVVAYAITLCFWILISAFGLPFPRLAREVEDEMCDEIKKKKG